MPNIFIAGQLSGVEGYIESISSGLVCGINMFNYINNYPLVNFGNKTMIGALVNYISSANVKHFQPMSSNMGLINAELVKIKDKKQKYAYLSNLALTELKEIISKNNI